MRGRKSGPLTQAGIGTRIGKPGTFIINIGPALQRLYFDQGVLGAGDGVAERTNSVRRGKHGEGQRRLDHHSQII